MSLVIKGAIWCLVTCGIFAGFQFISKRFAAEGMIDRRSGKLIAYYYSARISWPAERFAAAAFLSSVGVATAGTRFLGHWTLGLLLGLIVLGIIVQAVWMRSVGQSQKVDMDLPHFIGLLRSSFLATNGNERFALRYAVSNATLPALVNPLLVLVDRWEQGADLHQEAEKTKHFFRNKVVSHLLDSLVQEHYGGGSFIRDLDRLADQARDRFRLAEMRKVATAGTVYALYGILGCNLLLLLAVAIFDPAGIKLFRELLVGRLITGFSMLGYAGVILLAFRLIQLGDE